VSGQQRAVPVLEGDGRGRGQPSFALVESKLRAPWVRPGIVARKRLVERLLAAGSVPLVCVVAPAGHGKTTLLAQWGRSKADRVGWVSLDARDNDPVVLLTYLAVALDRIGPADPEVPELVKRAEGWPVGLYLATLAQQAGGSRPGAGAGFSGETGSWPTTCAPSCWRSCPPSGWSS
jgi:ATP/maltotriose-dependent transcriptional regulator MalT